MIELPLPLEKETLNEYIKRLLENNVIKPSQIPLAIKKFNKK